MNRRNFLAAVGRAVLSPSSAGQCRRHIYSTLRAATRSVIMITAFLVPTAPVSACPMCKDSKSVEIDSTSSPAESTGIGFNNSIYVMLGSLITIAGFTGNVLYRAAKSR